MKTLRRNFIFASLILLCFTQVSCKKDNGGDSQQVINWTINGMQLSGGNYARAQKMGALRVVTIQGRTDPTTTIQFSLHKCDTVGVYVAKKLEVDPNSAYAYLEKDGKKFDSDYCKDGERVMINVTHLSSSRISGNFNGEARSADSELATISGNFDMNLVQRP